MPSRGCLMFLKVKVIVEKPCLFISIFNHLHIALIFMYKLRDQTVLIHASCQLWILLQGNGEGGIKFSQYRFEINLLLFEKLLTLSPNLMFCFISFWHVLPLLCRWSISSTLAFQIFLSSIYHSNIAPLTGDWEKQGLPSCLFNISPLFTGWQKQGMSLCLFRRIPSSPLSKM